MNFAEGAETVSSFKFAGQQETWVGDLRTTLLVVLRLRSRVQQVLEDFSASNSENLQIPGERHTPVAALRTTLLKKPPAAPLARHRRQRTRMLHGFCMVFAWSGHRRSAKQALLWRL